MGIEPTRPAWKAGILPLNYTRTEKCGPKRQPRYDSIPSLDLSILFSKKLSEVGNDRRFYSPVGKDGRCLTLRPDAEGQICFSPQGVRLNGRFTDLLCQLPGQRPSGMGPRRVGHPRKAAGRKADPVILLSGNIPGRPNGSIGLQRSERSHDGRISHHTESYLRNFRFFLIFCFFFLAAVV